MTAIDPTKITTEFYVDGSWQDSISGTDLAGAIRGSDAIRITRGYVDQQTSFTPATASFLLNNRNGLFSADNALSPLYGKIKQNLPIRLGVKDDDDTWDEYLRMPDWDVQTTQQKLSTADKATLDVTGDIDIRIEFTATYLRNRRQNLAGKYVVGGNQRAWLLDYRSDGQFALLTSPDGTLTNALTNFSGVVLGDTAGRIAIRVTLDVNDGAGNRVYRWYASDSIDGTWTQFASGTVAGTTSIFNSSSALEVGSANDASGPFSDSRQWAGRIHAFQLYNGINGTLVADMRPQGRGVGQVAAWADTCATPNTWTLTGSNIRLGSDRIRLAGELSALPEEWDLTGNDRLVRATAASTGKRYISNKSALNSAIYRKFRNYTGLAAYFPLEDASGATQAANVIEATRPGILTSCTFGSTTGLDGSAGALTLTSGPNVSKAVFGARLPVTATGATSTIFYFKLDSLPASDQVFATILNAGGGLYSRWSFVIGSATFRFIAYDATGVETYNSGAVAFGTGASPLDQWLGMQLLWTQDGANVRFQTIWHVVGTSIFFSHFVGGTTAAGTLGRGVGRITFDTPDAAFAGAQIAHVIVSTTDTVSIASTSFAAASKGWSGETAGRRMIRLAAEEDEFFEWVGDIDSTQLVGPQTPDRLVNLFGAAATVDGGIFGEVRDMRGWRYVTRAALGNRRGLELDYSASHLDATPTPDRSDRYIVNDFTASRPSGSSARAVADDDRPLGVNDPDATIPGAGRYEQTGAFNAATDDQLYTLASAQVGIGTWPESRIPNISAALHRDEVSEDAGTIKDLIAADFGDPLGLTGLEAAPMAPDDRHLLIFGYTETIGQAGTWGWVANTVPAGPYQVPILGTTDSNGEPRMDADFGGHVQVHGAYASADTSIVLRTDQSFDARQVIDSTSFSAEFPCDFNIGGERVRMTACTAPATGTTYPADGTFESGVTNWSVSGASLASSTTFAHGGTKSALLTVTGSPTSAFIRASAGFGIPVTAGKLYSVSAWVRSTALLTDVHAIMSWYDASGTQLATNQGAVASLASGAWTQRTLTDQTAPAGAVELRLGVLIGSSPATGTVLYVDDVTFTTTGYVYQTATVTRAVNGIAKAQVNGEEVHLWDTFNLGMI